MRKTIIAAWVMGFGAAANAHAQPVELAAPISRPAACTVDIVRAPDDVRDVVEGWVGSELQCSVALEVRIVKTDGGLYLLARDDRGRAYERIVPDAESAGVLIASWAADDSVARAAPTPAPPRPVRVAIAPLAPPSDAPIAIAAVAPAPARSSRRLTVTGSIDLNAADLLGVRAQVDIWERRGFVIGAALAVEGTNGTGIDDYIYRLFRTQAIARIGRPFEAGGWSITPGVGFGESGGYGEQIGPYGSSSYSDSTFGPVGEATIMVSRALTDHLELTAGTLGRWYPRGWHDPQTIDLSLLGGLGWSL